MTEGTARPPNSPDPSGTARSPGAIPARAGDARAHGARRVVLTRPAGQSDAMAASLRDAGCEVAEFPLITIRPAADSALLDAALARADDYALVVFVSPNAVDHAFARFQGAWPERVPVGVVGPGSIAALNRHGIAAPRYRIIAPDGAVDQARVVAGDQARGLAGGLDLPPLPGVVAPHQDASAAINVDTTQTAAPAVRTASSSAASAASRAAAAARVVSSDSFFAAPPDPATVDAAAAATAEGSTLSASTDAPVDPDSVRFDSETLIAALERECGLASFAGKRVLLVRGDGGRELLADTLREHGADVEPVAAYQRGMPTPDPAALTRIRRWLAADDAVWVITSSEAVRNLETLTGIYFDANEIAALHRAQCVVPHRRIAESARKSGFDRVTTSAAGDAALTRAILLAVPQTDGATGTSDRSANGPAAQALAAGVPAAGAPGVTASAMDASAAGARVTGAPAAGSPTAGEGVFSRTGASPAASSTPRGASSSMTDSKDTLPNTTIPPTRFSASGADRLNTPGAGRQRGRLLLAWLALIVALGAGVGAAALNRKLERVERALNERQQTSERTATASTQESTRALEAAQQTDRRLSQIEGKLADAQGQQQALQNMYQDLARDRTQWTLSEIEQVVANASQQLQLTGNIPLALFALQSADARLAQTQGAQILVIRKAIATDIDKLKTTPSVDIAGLAIKLDDAIAHIDALPLAGEGPVPQADSPSASSGLGSSQATAGASAGVAGSSGALAASAASATGNPFSNAVRRFDAFWGEFGTRVLHQLAGVVQVRRIDNGDAMLIAPDQAIYLRDNLRIRLLSARLSLLSRDEKTMNSDLDAADAALARYFDPNAPATHTVRDLVAQVRHASTAVELPNLNASLDAIHQYKSGD